METTLPHGLGHLLAPIPVRHADTIRSQAQDHGHPASITTQDQIPEDIFYTLVRFACSWQLGKGMTTPDDRGKFEMRIIGFGPSNRQRALREKMAYLL